ncbi:uncharacterized protein LOC126821700 [Patella vulgata]|uniref:uncharacterized protein LOC126821700 n=1 Tax=Patella vulgata TaxID=6465 RepID=UPI00217F4558|nr:uncharacterized protein LOC126821700 [Patella vulgata]
MTTVLLSLVILTWFAEVDSQKCVYRDPCTCSFDHSAESVNFGVEGGVIDLHRISDDGNPLFLDPRESGGKFYEYSPCSAHPCPTIKDSSLCLTTKNTKKVLDLGDLKDMTFTTTANKTTGKLHTSMKYKASGTNITSIVHLICSETNEFRFEKMTSDSNYEFTLYSPCVCVDGCLAPGISAGSIIIILFFSSLLLYFGIGCLYKKVVYGATGQEIVPNNKFWFSLPGLVKDGYIFFISPCLGDRAEYRVYDRL